MTESQLTAPSRPSRRGLKSQVESEFARQEEQSLGRQERLNRYISSLGRRTQDLLQDSFRQCGSSDFVPGELGPRRAMLLRMAESRAFETLTFVSVIVSALLVALQLDLPEFHDTWQFLEVCCLAVFGLEVILKLLALHRQYFSDYWNTFDIAILIINFADLCGVIVGTIVGDTNVLRIVKGVKIIRFARLWKMLPELRKISKTITSSMQSMTWGAMLLGILLYMGGILSTVMLRDTDDLYPGYAVSEDEWEPLQEFNPLMYFGTVLNSMYTLFNLVLLTEFSEFARAVWIKQPFLLMCFAFFACCLCFGTQNLMMTACVEGVASAEKRFNDDAMSFLEERKLDIVQELCKALFSKDVEGRKVSTEAQLIEVLEDETMRSKVDGLDLPVNLSSSELFMLLDDTGMGEVPHRNFTRNAVRLIAGSTHPFEWSCLMQLTMHRIMARLCREQHGFQKPQVHGAVASPSVCTRNTLTPVCAEVDEQRPCHDCGQRTFLKASLHSAKLAGGPHLEAGPPCKEVADGCDGIPDGISRAGDGGDGGDGSCRQAWPDMQDLKDDLLMLLRNSLQEIFASSDALNTKIAAGCSDGLQIAGFKEPFTASGAAVKFELTPRRPGLEGVAAEDVSIASAVVSAGVPGCRGSSGLPVEQRLPRERALSPSSSLTAEWRERCEPVDEDHAGSLATPYCSAGPAWFSRAPRMATAAEPIAAESHQPA